MIFEQLNQIYLEAGEQIGALTFDLATEIEKITDGQDGGRYMYDPVHYTPLGNQLMKDTLEPVLIDIIEDK